MHTVRPIALFFGLTMILGACAHQSPSPGVYPRSSAMTAMHVHHGRVISVVPVLLEGRPSAVGTIGGAAVGRAVGRTTGGGSGARVTGAVGAVAGAVAGQAIEKSLTSEPGLEITVELDNGEVLAVVQGSEVDFRAGQRVRVLRGRGTARVRGL